MENNTILKFDGLSKKFGNKTVVDHISLEIKEGEIFGLLGPNGAGKSTTLNMVCSLLKPTSGNIEIFGMKTSNDMEKIKKKIGYIPQELYYLNAVKAPDAWEFIKGVPHEKVRVGIIDTGAQLDHP
ncbi:MAG: ATP-binding cassette domain-containing protein, partial [Oscillospiraceae bacterium]|nr:ATP-binding cassette domain-containing protein [Oscillospiraceae bacterium]